MPLHANICSPRLDACSSRSTPPTGSWSSSRRGTGRWPAEDAARELYALRHVPAGLARSLLTDVVDGDARLAWRGGSVGLAAPPGAALALEDATYVVFDLETTGLSPGSSAICEIGAVRVRGLELEERFETLVNPRRPLPAPIAALTGIDPGALRGAPPVELAVRRFLEFAGDAVLVAHNARFDMGFLDREVERLTGRRVASPVVDTVWLARRLLEGRQKRVGLASLALLLRHGDPAVPPRARGLGGDGGDPARADRPRAGAWRRDGRRSSSISPRRARAGSRASARSSPGRRRGPASTSSATATSRCSTSAAPATSARGCARTSAPSASGRRSRRRSARSSGSSGGSSARSWRRGSRSCGSCASCGRRRTRAARGPTATSTSAAAAPAGASPTRPGPYGPLKSRRRAQVAARALGDWDGEPPDALPALRQKLKRLSAELRFEDAARLRDRIAALEEVVASLAELDRLRALELCLLVPAAEDGFQRMFFVSGGRVAAARRCCPATPGRDRDRGGARRGRARGAVARRRPTPTSCS